MGDFVLRLPPSKSVLQRSMGGNVSDAAIGLMNLRRAARTSSGVRTCSPRASENSDVWFYKKAFHWCQIRQTLNVCDI